MKNLQELVIEYGMEYQRLNGENQYTEILEQETRWIKQRRWEEQEKVDLEKDFREVVRNLFNRGNLRVIDLRRFTESFEIKDSSGEDYPLWFFDTVKIVINCNRNQICFDAEKDYMKQNEVVKKMMKDEVTEKSLVSWLPGLHPLERIFADGKIENQLECGLLNESERFANALSRNKKAVELKTKILESLNEEFCLLLKE